ncbi:hypothetical protein B0H14DRAFT_2590433 [Mycena olivaceomarginata]|nr:hypothetical protein B0H14DRAFT_2590433 [Mycena olivaceomarginata]
MSITSREPSFWKYCMPALLWAFILHSVTAARLSTVVRGKRDRICGEHRERPSPGQEIQDYKVYGAPESLQLRVLQLCAGGTERKTTSARKTGGKYRLEDGEDSPEMTETREPIVVHETRPPPRLPRKRARHPARSRSSSSPPPASTHKLKETTDPQRRVPTSSWTEGERRRLVQAKWRETREDGKTKRERMWREQVWEGNMSGRSGYEKERKLEKRRRGRRKVAQQARCERYPDWGKGKVIEEERRRMGERAKEERAGDKDRQGEGAEKGRGGQGRGESEGSRKGFIRTPRDEGRVARMTEYEAKQRRQKTRRLTAQSTEHLVHALAPPTLAGSLEHHAVANVSEREGGLRENDNKGRRKPRSGNDRGRKEEREVEEGQGLKNEAEEVQKGEEGERTNDHDPIGRTEVGKCVRGKTYAQTKKKMK